MKRKDEDIKKDVIDQLYWDGRVDASDISVSVQEGRVRLSGTVPEYSARQAAYEDTWAIRGVRAVENDVTVMTMLPAPDDLKLRIRIVETLQDLVKIDPAGLNVTVDNGWTDLEGSVDSYWKKLRAEEIVSIIPGIRGITNKLAVVPTHDIQDELVAEKIMKALSRQAEINEESVYVKVEKGRVTLSGSAPSWVAHKAVHETAAQTEGVREIRDQVVISLPE
jgi:hyperosmotically inducible periplasmic protein